MAGLLVVGGLGGGAFWYLRRPKEEAPDFKTAAVTRALKEFVARREQRRLVELFGRLEWDPGYDHKRERSRS